ncbi:MAG: hypothetical protein EA369_09410 [Bradymonadales bacterium]|nr:MAG: hypothetical protein EA369_09410 [Bradymonadales bacterium]
MKSLLYRPKLGAVLLVSAVLVGCGNKDNGFSDPVEAPPTQTSRNQLAADYASQQRSALSSQNSNAPSAPGDVTPISGSQSRFNSSSGGSDNGMSWMNVGVAAAAAAILGGPKFASKGLQKVADGIGRLFGRKPKKEEEEEEDRASNNAERSGQAEALPQGSEIVEPPRETNPASQTSGGVVISTGSSPAQNKNRPEGMSDEEFAAFLKLLKILTQQNEQDEASSEVLVEESSVTDLAETETPVATELVLNEPSGFESAAELQVKEEDMNLDCLQASAHPTASTDPFFRAVTRGLFPATTGLVETGSQLVQLYQKAPKGGQ